MTNTYTKISTFIIFFIIYILFMDFNAPLGADWLPWHAQRILNATEFLKINGYFSNFGFSILTSCENCDLSKETTKEYIYLSRTIFTFLPYIFINHFFGQEYLLFLGPLIDKIVILICGIVLSDISITLLNDEINKVVKYFISLIVFIFFIVNPWTYKMIISSWYILYFLLFLLLSIFFLIKKKINFFLISLLFASLFDYQSASGIIVFLMIIFLINKKKQNELFKEYLINNENGNFLKKIFFVLLVPIIIHFILVILAKNNLDQYIGSSILNRIGISGNDIHNGGLIGSLQFLFGNRITICHTTYDLQNLLIENAKTEKLISIYNCLLSLIGMFFVSILSIYGACKLYLSNERFEILLLPLTFLLLSYISILQQSLSVHLMGYSILFAPIFSIGFIFFIKNVINSKKYFISKFILSIPFFAGILILCIRVNMLTGPNG